jgi:hypothetical protein
MRDRVGVCLCGLCMGLSGSQRHSTKRTWSVGRLEDHSFSPHARACSVQSQTSVADERGEAKMTECASAAQNGRPTMVHS